MGKKSRYSDIIDLPHHQSIYRPHMTIYNRAAQFAPFAALVGYDEMVQDAADFRLLDQRIVLSEDEKTILDIKLQLVLDQIKQNPEIRVVYFDEMENKFGGGYIVYSGKVKKFEEYPLAIIFTDRKKVLLEDIIDIDIVIKRV